MKTHSYEYEVMSRRELVMILLALDGCALSLLPLPLMYLGWVDMKYSFWFCIPPALLLLLALGVFASRTHVPTFWTRYSVGFLAGITATVAYDLARVLGLAFRFQGFQVIHRFGLLILGAGENHTPLTMAVGWLYHFLNGGVFDMVFTLALGRRGGIVWGIVWGLALEAFMVSMYPILFKMDFAAGSAALTFSLLGHVAYGTALGLCVRRWLTAPPAGGTPA